MNVREAESIVRLLRHLDGTQVLDEVDLYERDITYLQAFARKALGGLPVPLDDDQLVDTLAEVAQRHADAGR
jgi:hypothetical protein